MIKYLMISSLAVASAVAAQENLLSEEGLSALEFGMTIDEALVALPHYRSELEPGEEHQGCYYLSPIDTESKLPSIMVSSKKPGEPMLVVRVGIRDPDAGLRLTNGLGIGSTEQEVLDLYPQATERQHEYGGPEDKYLRIKLPDRHGIVFETSKGVVMNYRIGLEPNVYYVEGCA